MTAQDALADAVLASRELLTRFLVGFDEDSRTRQAVNLPNHVIWNLGHVALSLDYVAEQIDGRPLPETDFVAGDGHSGTPDRFDIESIRMGSTPVVDSGHYPTLARGVEVHDAACDRLASAVRGADAATLGRKVEWIGTELSLAALVSRVTFHSGVHTGQITDLRRALGLERVIQP